MCFLWLLAHVRFPCVANWLQVGETPLAVAAKKNQVPMCRWLASRKADINGKDQVGWLNAPTPTSATAATSSSPTCLVWPLLSLQRGMAVIHHAIVHGATDVVEWLLASGVDTSVTTRVRIGCHMLHTVCGPTASPMFAADAQTGLTVAQVTKKRAGDATEAITKLLRAAASPPPEMPAPTFVAAKTTSLEVAWLPPVMPQVMAPIKAFELQYVGGSVRSRGCDRRCVGVTVASVAGMVASFLHSGTLCRANPAPRRASSSSMASAKTRDTPLRCARVTATAGARGASDQRT